MKKSTLFAIAIGSISGYIIFGFATRAKPGETRRIVPSPLPYGFEELGVGA